MAHEVPLAATESVTVQAVIDAVRTAFVGFHRGEFEMPVRISFDSGSILTMPVHHRPTGTAVVKVLRIDAERSPAISGLIVWSSADGELAFDAAELTAMRTGAASGVATDLLARADASVMTIIGAGAQAYHQIASVLAVRDITDIRIFARNPVRARSLIARTRSAHPDIRVAIVEDLSSSLGDTDILTCVTSSTEPVFESADLPERIHINAVGAYRLDMREVPNGAFESSDVVIDSWDAARHEAGDLMSALHAGVLGPSDVTELGARILAGSGARAPRTLFKSVGLAIQDWAVASALGSLSSHTDSGTHTEERHAADPLARAAARG